MNIQSRYPSTPDEFLRWNEGREGKREFVRGKVVEMMIHVTRNHVSLATNIILAFRPRFDRFEYSIGTADFGVRTPDGIRYPDVFIDRHTPQSRGADLAASEPVLLAEILSPSSYARDFVEKLTDYQGIGSLFYYLILSQDEPRVWLSARNGEEWTTPEETAGEDEIVCLPLLGLEVPLAELYAGIERR